MVDECFYSGNKTKKMNVEIDHDSGFCFGVLAAIGKAEEELKKDRPLYCLGDIVHNGIECERLSDMGLRTINHDQFKNLTNAKVLLRAHGEPPSTYETAKKNNINIVDATCPVVLKLQKSIHKQYMCMDTNKQQIIIFGQKGHAEVLGLVGQTEGKAIVLESIDDIDYINFSKDIYLYSQTTKSASGYNQLIEIIAKRVPEGIKFNHKNTVCGQVSHRREHLRDFAANHGLIFFVAGKKSSNGKILFNECLNVNSKSYLIEDKEDIEFKLLEGVQSIGICGATSTPKWLMEECRNYIINYYNNGNKK